MPSERRRLMKVNFLYGSFAVLLICFIVLTRIKDDEQLSIITSPKIYSLYQTSDNETFRISLLTSKANSYHFDRDYIFDSAITSDDESYLPLEIKSITAANYEIEINEIMYQEIIIECYVPFNMEDETIAIENAFLELTYDQDETLKLDIGEFNLLFKNESNPFLTLGNLYTTHQTIDGFDTVGSIVLELGNLSNKSITITKVSILSTSAVANAKYIQKTMDLPPSDMKLNDILEENYDFFEFKDKRIQIDLNPSNQAAIIIPVAYIGSIRHIERFALIIYYEDQKREYQMIIDDFPFILRSPFQTQYQGDFVTYELD